MSDFTLLMETFDSDMIKTYDFFDYEANTEEHRSFKAYEKYTHDEMFIRKIPNMFSPNEIEKFMEHVNMLSAIKHPCFSPFYYAILPDDINYQEGCLVTKYYKNGSLIDVIRRIQEGNQVENWNFTTQTIILYGVAHFMDYIHSIGLVHGRLKASNILLSNDFEPKVTDIGLTTLEQQEQTIIDQEYAQKSDIRSFGVVCIQVYRCVENIYEESFQFFCQNNFLPEIILPSHIPSEIKDVISQCLKENTGSRPSFSEILNVFHESMKSVSNVDSSLFFQFEEKLKNGNEKITKHLQSIKTKADRGDMSMMHKYGVARLSGADCSFNKQEAIKYIVMAANLGYPDSIRLLRQMREQDTSKIDDSSDENESNLSTSSSFTSLYVDPFFQCENFDFDSIIKKVNDRLKKEDSIEIPQNFVTNFVFSEGAVKRLSIIAKYIECGVPVLIEGPTGASKTFSIEVVCSLLGKKCERLNLCSDTSVSDLLGGGVGDEDSWSGITYVDGPFIRAFKEGHCLLLDEINLAPETILQCIEESLDSGIISVDIPGMPLREIEMSKGFCLVATQNPNKEYFIGKRQDLGLKFLSRFQVINFPELEKEELLTIAEGLAEKFKYNDSQDLIEVLVDFHYDWSNDPLISNDIQCFTIREIAATVKALSDDENFYDSVMTIYGARYPSSIKQKMTETFEKHYKKEIVSVPFEIPENFPPCFRNEALSSAIRSIMFSFNNNNHVIIVGPEGNGKTQLARWISEWHSASLTIDTSSSDYFCVCTDATRCSDLIGRIKILESSEPTSELMVWEDGFLNKAIKEGICAVLDNINEAKSTVTERLNSLLDQTYDGKEKLFAIPENPTEKQIKVNDNFRLICTCDIKEIKFISPAFLNRFDIIVLEDQLSGIEESDLRCFVELQLKRYHDEKLDVSIDEDVSEDSMIEIVDDDDQQQTNSDYCPSSELVSYVLESIKGKNISFVSKLCKAVSIYTSIMPKCQNFEEKEIVNFAINMLNGPSDFAIPENIEGKLRSLLWNIPEKFRDQFFYEESPSLLSFMCKLMAASLINLHVCVTGSTGVGKTTSAIVLSLIRNYNSKYKIHSFHSDTSPDHFYGTTTIRDGNVVFRSGTLTTALQNGETFIADEMNLSPKQSWDLLHQPSSLILEGASAFLESVIQLKSIVTSSSLHVKMNLVQGVAKSTNQSLIASDSLNIQHKKKKESKRYVTTFSTALLMIITYIIPQKMKISRYN